jgi:hypothetical protein
MSPQNPSASADARHGDIFTELILSRDDEAVETACFNSSRSVKRAWRWGFSLASSKDWNMNFS